MNKIFHRFIELEESLYLDSMTEADEDASGQQAEVPQQQDENAQQPQPPQNAQLATPVPEGQPQDPNMIDQNAMVGGDPNQMGFDPNAMGTQGVEELKTPSSLGRIYELNKIYYRLYVINKFLKNTSDERLLKLKRISEEAFDIYRLILNNIKVYKDRIDEIIIHYYEFLSELISEVEKYYKKKHTIDINNKE